MKVIPIGTKVKTVIGEIKALVTGISIRGAEGSFTQYEISYFQNGSYASAWVMDFEFEIDKSTKPGFVNYDDNQLLIEK